MIPNTDNLGTSLPADTNPTRYFSDGLKTPAPRSRIQIFFKNLIQSINFIVYLFGLKTGRHVFQIFFRRPFDIKCRL
ncbi:hypothetical protein l13_12140 [Neisseria weaveri ATCC 51223]|nr:hypothetical protein l13_12140 [Neisseria weaveri ATCC 51223]